MYVVHYAKAVIDGNNSDIESDILLTTNDLQTAIEFIDKDALLATECEEKVNDSSSVTIVCDDEDDMIRRVAVVENGCVKTIELWSVTQTDALRSCDPEPKQVPQMMSYEELLEVYNSNSEHSWPFSTPPYIWTTDAVERDGWFAPWSEIKSRIEHRSGYSKRDYQTKWVCWTGKPENKG